ncbi:aldehyde dehydrogenase family protein [Actinoplanes derwentensis]|uniref:Aldehyde dehydrogenase (NAD+) n=1 Tax=Actinoplanes derwentensis TaxID=113562 RepID=A0A1H2AZI2_9ACTN|nr:aldehyde dehydrogenase family protein [Actinoplanes derwentensis]GID87216.1 betaine-aldehyde dehydrogenase [Actinoplanes derwentensis]SDT51314.1 aldehyde dehydrogenase (NAD+) [Actinoplanes derwentensis]
MVLSIKARRDEAGLSAGELLIDGRWRPAGDGNLWTHHHPATAEEVGTFAIAGVADVDAAVRSARAAFDDGPWPRARAKDRIRVLRRIADGIRGHAEELQTLVALDNGVPVSFGETYAMSVECVADIFEHHAGWVDKIGGETLPGYQGGDHMVFTLREPVGAVAAVIPWNGPLLLAAQKLAPALAAGCTVVLKPSEFATFSVLRLVRIIEEAGLPAGVLNVVTGPGETTGDALINHPLIDKITFTGSRGVGRKVLAAAANGIKRVSLELGGKSPSVVFPDADVYAAATTTMGTVTLGLSGQACVAHTRALVHRDVYDEFLAIVEAMAALVNYGDPFHPETTASPLINERQLDRVLGYIESGRAEGARLIVGGDRLDGELAAGNFVQPTVFADVSNDATIAREEIFGPVLAVIPFTDEDEAIRLANDTSYGLAATVWTADVRRAFRMTKALRAGTVGVNGYQLEPHVAFGGHGQSGLNREGGRSSIEAYTELKTVLIPTSDEMM